MRDIHSENVYGGIRDLQTNISKQSPDIWSHMKAVMIVICRLNDIVCSFKGKSAQETAQQVIN